MHIGGGRELATPAAIAFKGASLAVEDNAAQQRCLSPQPNREVRAMAHDVPRIGTDGAPLPVMPPERDPRLSIRVIRVMFYTPGFQALLLLKAGEPTGFGVTIEFLMLASAASVVAGLIIATQSSGASADAPSKVAT